jgi:hypothetical protein
MALTFPRWVIAMAMGAALLWLGFFHTRAAPKPRERPEPEITAADAAARAGAAMTRAADRLRLLQIRDSIMQLPASRANGAPTVLISASYDATIARQLDALIRQRWSAAGAGQGTRTIIAAVIDTSTAVSTGLRPRLANLTSIAAFLPDSNDNRPCLSILRVPVAVDSRTSVNLRRDLLAPETIGAMIGPCLYYAVFGKPGTRVADWLGNGGWRLSHVTDWQAPPPPLLPPSWIARRGIENAYESFVYQPRLWTTTDGLACLAGEPGRCTAALIPAPRRNVDTTWQRRVVTAMGASENVFRIPRGRSVLGPSEGWLLSEMVRTLGKERFAAFWRSGEPVPDAFHAATNENLDVWVHDWAVRMYGPLPIGPGVSISGTMAGLALLLVAAVAAMSVSRVRRVT